MGTYKGEIWQRLKEVHKNFRARCDENPVSAHIERASVYYCLSGCYQKWWQWPVTLWYLRQAVSNLTNARTLDKSDFKNLSYEEIDTVAAILAKVPRWLHWES
ncbi:MAG: hypothetical protein AAB641_00285 [Patescibacteria group bacterium]